MKNLGKNTDKSNLKELKQNKFFEIRNSYSKANKEKIGTDKSLFTKEFNQYIDKVNKKQLFSNDKKLSTSKLDFITGEKPNDSKLTAISSLLNTEKIDISNKAKNNLNNLFDRKANISNSNYNYDETLKNFKQKISNRKNNSVEYY